MNSIVNDTTNPISSVQIRVNVQETIPYWQSMLASQNIPGSVIIGPGSVPGPTAFQFSDSSVGQGWASYDNSAPVFQTSTGAWGNAGLTGLGVATTFMQFQSLGSGDYGKEVAGVFANPMIWPLACRYYAGDDPMPITHEVNQLNADAAAAFSQLDHYVIAAQMTYAMGTLRLMPKLARQTKPYRPRRHLRSCSVERRKAETSLRQSPISCIRW